MSEKGTVTVRVGRTSSDPVSVKVDGNEIRDHLRIYKIAMPELSRDSATVLELTLRVDEFEFEVGNLFEVVSEETGRRGRMVRLRSIIDMTGDSRIPEWYRLANEDPGQWSADLSDQARDLRQSVFDARGSLQTLGIKWDQPLEGQAGF